MKTIQWIGQPFTVLTVTPQSAGGANTRRTQVARVQVDKADARGWQVTLSPLTFGGAAVDPALGAPVPILALVTWGWDGVNFTAEVDWPSGGARFEVWGDNVNVDLAVPGTFQSDPILPAPVLSSSVTAGAIITPGAAYGGPRVTRSVLSPIVAPGGFSAPVPIPAFARSVRWHQVINLSPGNSPIPLFFATSQDPGLAYIVQTTPADLPIAGLTDIAGYTTSERTWPTPDGLTISPQARFLVFGNLDPVPLNDVQLRLEFVLDLG